MKVRRWHVLLLLVLACAFTGSSPVGSATTESHRSGHRQERVVRAGTSALPASAFVDTTRTHGAKRHAIDDVDVADARGFAFSYLPFIGAQVLTGKPRSPIVDRAPGRAPPHLQIVV